MAQQPAHTQPTRRTFLQSAALAGSALAMNQLTANVHAAGSDTIKVGVIGCGGRGSGAAENVLHSAKGVQVVAIGDVFKFRVDGLRRRLTKRAQSDEKIVALGNSVDLPQERCFAGLDAYEKVINSDANYIILATPPGFRPQCLQAAVSAGKNIFTEKPVASDCAGIRKVLAAYEEAKKKGLAIVAGTQRRHQLAYVETIKQIQNGAIGDVTAMRCYWNGTGIWFRERKELEDHGEKATDLAYQLHNWYHFVWTCGDHIVEQHIHNLDVCNWVMGKHPIKAMGMGARTARPNKYGDPNKDGHIFDQFAIDFEYDNGVHMLSMCRHIPGTPNKVSEAIVGTKGMSDPSGSINGKRILTKEQNASAVDPYVQEHTDLIASIREGKPLNELQEVAYSTLTAIMGRHAGYTGREVTWDFLLNKSQENLVPAKLDWNMSMPPVSVAIPGRTRLA